MSNPLILTPAEIEADLIAIHSDIRQTPNEFVWHIWHDSGWEKFGYGQHVEQCYSDMTKLVVQALNDGGHDIDEVVEVRLIRKHFDA